MPCSKKWGKFLYQGLLFEFEEEGQSCTMCHIFVEIDEIVMKKLH